MLAWLNWLFWLVGLVVCVVTAVYLLVRASCDVAFAIQFAVQEQRFGIVEPTTSRRRVIIFAACFAYAWLHAHSPSIRWRNTTRRSDYERYQLMKQKDE